MVERVLPQLRQRHHVREALAEGGVLGFDGSLPCEHGRQRRKCPICELVQAEEELEDLLAENAALRKRLADVMPLVRAALEMSYEVCTPPALLSARAILERNGLIEYHDIRDRMEETDLARLARAAVKGEG